MKWSTKDKKLFAAVHALENEKCRDCGTPIWQGHTTDRRVEFQISYQTCFACAEIEEMKKHHALEPGEKVAVKVVDPDKNTIDLPTRAEGYAKMATTAIEPE